MDQAAEQVTAADAIKVDQIGHRALAAGRRLAERWPLPEGAVRPVLVVMPRVIRENVLQVAAPEPSAPRFKLPAHRTTHEQRLIAVISHVTTQSDLVDVNRAKTQPRPSSEQPTYRGAVVLAFAPDSRTLVSGAASPWVDGRRNSIRRRRV